MKWIDMLWYKEDREAMKDVKWMQEEIVYPKSCCCKCSKLLEGGKENENN